MRSSAVLGPPRSRACAKNPGCRIWPIRVRARARAEYGVVHRSSRASNEETADDPEQDGKPDRSDHRGQREPLALVWLEAMARIPDQVADAAQHVMDQRPGVAEQDESPEERVDEGAEGRIGVRARARRDQPPRHQQRADIEPPAGDAMQDRHRHRQWPAIDLQVGRERPLGGLSTGHYQSSSDAKPGAPSPQGSYPMSGHVAMRSGQANLRAS